MGSRTQTIDAEDKAQFSSKAPTIVDGRCDADVKEKQIDFASEEPEISSMRQIVIVFIVCFAQFFDIFASSSTIVALPSMGDDLNFKPSELPWVITAYTLTFASFQLIGGRLSDIFHAKLVFLVGCVIVGVMGIICAVSINPIMLIIFRALQGIGAAFTVPSAVAIIVQTVTDPERQSLSLAAFAGAGAMGNAAGFVLGGVLTSRASWVWVFYLVSIIILPLCIPSFFIIPGDNNGRKDRKLDYPGVGALTVAVILFVYAISDASNTGWGKPQIVVPLVLSGVFVIAFFLIESRVKDPAVPPSVWSTPNIIPLFIYASSQYWFVYVFELNLVEIFQDIFGWSALSASVHCIPIGVAGGISSYLSGRYGPRVSKRILLPLGQVLMVVASILFALGDTAGKYWSHLFIGMVLGMLGIGIAYVGVMVAVMKSARKGEEGVVSALLNTVFQLGATIGIAISSAIVLGVNNKLPADAPLTSHLSGYKDSFWALLAMNGLMFLVSLTVR